MEEYYTVYETGKFEFHIYLGYIILIIMLLAFSFTAFHNVKYKTTLSGETLCKTVIMERVFSIIGFICILFFFLNIIVANINDYTFIKNTYYDGEYNVVEGKIENFIPMKIEGHSQESFTVDEVEFSYTRSTPKYGYHFPKIDGGYLTGNDQYVKISYISYNLNSIRKCTHTIYKNFV